MSAHANSHSNYANSGAPPSNPGFGFFSTCMQSVCGVDPGVSLGRKYSTTMEDNSSFTAFTQHNLNFEDECRITLSRFTKQVNGRDARFIMATALLFDDEVDEAHDLFYLVRMPDVSTTSTVSLISSAVRERAQGSKLRASSSDYACPENV